MEYFISTFIIMLICIIALLQDKSYDNGIVLPRPQSKLPDRRDYRLLKYNQASHSISRISPQLLVSEYGAQTGSLATSSTARRVYPSNFNRTKVLQPKSNPTIQSNTEKDTDVANAFCSQCNLSFFAPACNYYKQSFKVA
ncbi:hypothetical protein ACRQ5D_29320 [Mucilaginibacter sp. P25]|uniref:Uncharacterized protein n=1 Tax=Mucilaginibacter gossypii TaxID=551996 RepID=A0A1G7NJD5_9SPHI|nr:hypothetical protein [Mucilaginibacter gossypii]SDF73380.1 hypothetical protein SAMN05192573_101245 [Mucilaginibacter gossypii]